MMFFYMCWTGHKVALIYVTGPWHLLSFRLFFWIQQKRAFGVFFFAIDILTFHRPQKTHRSWRWLGPNPSEAKLEATSSISSISAPLAPRRKTGTRRKMGVTWRFLSNGSPHFCHTCSRMIITRNCEFFWDKTQTWDLSHSNHFGSSYPIGSMIFMVNVYR